ncbi:hypothetical protein ABT298_26905 [Streptomyces sp. NPDC001034]|uniref:hypothetical protein n=1 Tax=Streptomyces sp. NPDC001034 TaxID=3154375 RepID=UPI00331BD201
MQHHIGRTTLTAAVLVIAAALGGCDDEPRKVSGLLDSTRHVHALTGLATRAHMVKRCHSGSKRVRHTSGRGGDKRTWYTDEPTTVCTKVRQGTETYRRVIRPERWCIRLDDVDGKDSRDDVWYRVDNNTYLDARMSEAGHPMTFEPEHDGC